MKALLVLIFVMISNFAMASLFQNEKVFFLAEELSSARYDYNHGVDLSLQEKIKLNELLPNVAPARKSYCESFQDSSAAEIIEVVEHAIQIHLDAYADDEFDFDQAVDELANELSSYQNIVKCIDNFGSSKYFDVDSGDFILSYRLL